MTTSEYDAIDIDGKEESQSIVYIKDSIFSVNFNEEGRVVNTPIGGNVMFTIKVAISAM